MQVATLGAVDGQLDRFAEEMAADSEAQRAAMRSLLSDEARRAEGAVSEVLQLSNLGGLTPYVFGSKGDSADLPIAQVGPPSFFPFGFCERVSFGVGTRVDSHLDAAG